MTRTLGILPASAAVLLATVWLSACSRPVPVPPAEFVGRGGEGKLAGHWPLDEGAGEIAHDRSGHGNDGRIVPGSGGWVKDGPFGASFRFDESHIDCGSPDVLGNLDRFTWTAWVRLDGYGGGNSGRILSKGSGPNSLSVSYEERCLIYRNDRHHPDGGDSTDGAWATPPGTILRNRWYFVGMTYDNRLPSREPAFFIDGTYVPAVKQDHPRGEPAPDKHQRLLIGDVGGLTRPFEGSICQVRVYHGLLSPAEIQALWAEGAR